MARVQGGGQPPNTPPGPQPDQDDGLSTEFSWGFEGSAFIDTWFQTETFLPSGARGHVHSPAEWRALDDETTPDGDTALGCRGNDRCRSLNLALAKAPLLRDLDLSVYVKAVSGELNQGGGLVWRYMDEDNYYACQLDPLHDNCCIYIVHEGHREEVERIDVDLETGRWYLLRVVVVDDAIRCSVDDEPLLDASDERIDQDGLVGVCSNGDATTVFDLVVVRKLADE